MRKPESGKGRIKPPKFVGQSGASGAAAVARAAAAAAAQDGAPGDGVEVAAPQDAPAAQGAAAEEAHAFARRIALQHH